MMAFQFPFLPQNICWGHSPSWAVQILLSTDPATVCAGAYRKNGRSAAENGSDRLWKGVLFRAGVRDSLCQSNGVMPGSVRRMRLRKGVGSGYTQLGRQGLGVETFLKVQLEAVEGFQAGREVI